MWIVLLVGASSARSSQIDPCQDNISCSAEVTAESLVFSGDHDDAQACFKMQLVDLFLSDPFDTTILSNVTLGIVEAFSYAGVPHDTYSEILCDAVAMSIYTAAVPCPQGGEFDVTGVMGVLRSGGFVLNELATTANSTVLGSALGEAARGYVSYVYPRYTIVAGGLTSLVFGYPYEDRRNLYEAYAGQLLVNASCSVTSTIFGLATALNSFDYYGKRLQNITGSSQVAPITKCKEEKSTTVYFNTTSAKVGDIVLT